MKTETISLSRGRFTLVDPVDFERWGHLSWKFNGEYAARCVQGPTGKWTTQYLHRVILEAKRGQVVDHRNHDGLDNRRANLRLCAQWQNVANQRHRQSPTSSRFKGVSWASDRGRWEAYIRVRGKHHHLGRFADEITAAAVYDAAAQAAFGEFAYLNFPEAKP